MARPKVDHDERRVRLAEAACEVIVAEGLENARLSEIASRAEVTTGFIQHYFRSKTDLLFFAKNHAADRTQAKFEAAASRVEGAEKLYALIRGMLPTSAENMKIIRLLEAFRGRAVGDTTLSRNQHARDRRFLELLERLLRDLQAQGLVRKDVDVPRAALGLNAMLEGLGTLVIVAPAAYKSVDQFAIVSDYVQRVLGVPPPASR